MLSRKNCRLVLNEGLHCKLVNSCFFDKHPCTYIAVLTFAFCALPFDFLLRLRRVALLVPL
jgi:hypothetical protein